MKILMVLTSYEDLDTTGKKAGVWLEEFAAPYYTFLDAGAAVTIVSLEGGQLPLDPESGLPENQTEVTRRFRADTAAQIELANTKRFADVSPDNFDAVFYSSGRGRYRTGPTTRNLSRSENVNRSKTLVVHHRSNAIFERARGWLLLPGIVILKYSSIYGVHH